MCVRVCVFNCVHYFVESIRTVVVSIFEYMVAGGLRVKSHHSIVGDFRSMSIEMVLMLGSPWVAFG